MRQRAWVARLPRTRGRRRPAWHPPALVKVIGVLMSVVLAATLSPASDAHARPAAAVANGSGADIRVGGVAIEALPVDRSPVRAGQDLKLEFDFTGDPDMTEGVMDRIAQDLKRIDSDYPVGNCRQRCGPSSRPIGTGAVPPPGASVLEHAAVCGEAPGTPQLQNAVSVADMTAFALFSASPKVPGSAVTARPTARPSSVAPPRVS